MYKQEKEKLFYSFVPPGKWHYDGKMRESDSHVFTATVLFDELVVAQQDSVSFHIVRVWHIDNNKPIESLGSAKEGETTRIPSTSAPCQPRSSLLVTATSSSPIRPQQPIHPSNHVPRSSSNSGASVMLGDPNYFNFLLSMPPSSPCSPIMSMQPYTLTASPSRLPFYPLQSLPLLSNDERQKHLLDCQFQQQLGYMDSVYHLPFPFPSASFLSQSPPGRFSTFPLAPSGVMSNATMFGQQVIATSSTGSSDFSPSSVSSWLYPDTESAFRTMLLWVWQTVLSCN